MPTRWIVERITARIASRCRYEKTQSERSDGQGEFGGAMYFIAV